MLALRRQLKSVSKSFTYDLLLRLFTTTKHAHIQYSGSSIIRSIMYYFILYILYKQGPKNTLIPILTANIYNT